jgi:hypothetical protein
MDVNQFGETACVQYLDSQGTSSCSDANTLPKFSVWPAGLITTSDNSIYGIMDSDGTAAYLIANNGGQAGIMVMEP